MLRICLPVKVQSLMLDIDHSKWKTPRSHSTVKQAAIRCHIDSLLALGVTEESQASYWSQLHMVKKPANGEKRMTLDFNTATRWLEGWPIPSIQQSLAPEIRARAWGSWVCWSRRFVTQYLIHTLKSPKSIEIFPPPNTKSTFTLYLNKRNYSF